MTTQTLNNTTSTNAQVAYNKLLPAAALAAGVGAVGNLIVYFLAGALGVNWNAFTIPQSNMPIAPVVVVIATVMGILGGTVVYALLGRFTARPVFLFRIIGIVVLVLSFIQPLLLTSAGAPTGLIIALEVMHVVAGAAAIYFLTTRAAK